MWHVIQTRTGKEKELVEIIEKFISKRICEKCFIFQQECVWRIEGSYRIHLEPLFPSYVFVETDIPEEFYFSLKQIPKLTKLLWDGECFWTVQKEEEELLKNLSGGNEEYIIRRSFVYLSANGEILAAEGALKEYVGKIIKKRLRKRRVVIEIPFLGEKKRIQLGIRLPQDEEMKV